MKKQYQKPEAEYISLEAEDIVTGPVDGEYGESDLPPDWEE